MLPDPGTYLLLVVVGGLVAVDGTGCGQFMLSRPLVAATLAGWIAGDPAVGAVVGLVIEAFHLTVLPVGAARYPEAAPAAVAAGAVLAGGGIGWLGLLTAAVFSLAWGWLGGETVRAMRQWNVRLLAPVAADRTSPALLTRRHLAALGLDLLRGMFLVAGGIAVFAAMLGLSRAAAPAADRLPELAVVSSVAALLASSLRLFGGRWLLFAAGVATGLLLLLVRP